MKSSLEKVVNKLSDGFNLVGYRRQWAEESQKFNREQIKYQYRMASIYQVANREMIYHFAISNSDKYPSDEKAMSILLYVVNTLEDTSLKQSLLAKLKS